MSLTLLVCSPIDYGHVLLCPRVLDCIPQVLDPSTCLTALHFALEVNNPYMRVGFNSLGAFATINHLHFQVREPKTALQPVVNVIRQDQVLSCTRIRTR